MPELAEVVYYSQRWNQGLGERIEEAKLNQKVRCFRDQSIELLDNVLVGSTYQSAETHGKQMLLRFSGDVCLGVHLGMTGTLRCGELDEPELKHDHLVLLTKKRKMIFSDPRQFGRIRIHQGKRLPEWWTNLAVEMLSDDFDYGLFSRFCERRKRSVVKAFLLIQELFPGVGNWMADEILWKARIRPSRRVGELDEGERTLLFESIQFVCKGAMKYIAPDWTDPPKSWLFTHRWKDGGECPQTGVVLKREEIGGRTTCWSEGWQK